MDHGSVEDLLKTIRPSKLSVRIPLRVLMADPGDFGEVFVSCAIPVLDVSIDTTETVYCGAYFSMYSLPAFAKY